MPFDQERSGLNLGEGAGILILETEAAARDRGLSPDLFLSGYGSAADAYHLTAPRPDGTGLSTAITKAMQEAGITASDISFINAHGTGTKENDRVEGQVFANMFRPNLPFLSTKGFTGHTLGAAGAIEAVFTAAALREGWIPASPGFRNPDPEIGATPVTTRTTVTGVYALSTSLAFGGSNSALVFGERKVRSMHLNGIGLLFNRGRGVHALEGALKEGWQPATPWSDAKNGVSAYQVPAEAMVDRVLLGKLRRAGRFDKLSVLAAWDAVQNSGIDEDEIEGAGIIVGTAFGPHPTTFKFLDDIIDYGHGSVSPTLFSHSVHNAAASYIATTLQCRGPILTLAQFYFPFQYALFQADAWIREGRCDHVLVGCTDVLGNVMAHIFNEKLPVPNNGKIEPFSFSETPGAIPGEGSVFFLVSSHPGPNRWCSVSVENKEALGADLMLLETDGVYGDETAYLEQSITDHLVSGYSPLFGSMMIGGGFQAAVGALMLARQVYYGCPVTGNPYGLSLLTGKIHLLR